MANRSRIQIGSPVLCDGASCGTVMRIVIDPAAGVLTHLAIGARTGAGHLVPAQYIDSTVQGIELTLTRAQFDALVSDQDQELVADANEAFARRTAPHSSAAVGALSVFGEIAPVGITRQFSSENVPETRSFDRVPAGEEGLKPAEQVNAIDGPVGRVSGVDVDLATRQITHLLIDAGHLWRKRHTAIAIKDVEHVGISVQVSLTKQQIDELDDGQPG
jgi:sporulation protein YlmC with PRC-barrel domain